MRGAMASKDGSSSGGPPQRPVFQPPKVWPNLKRQIKQAEFEVSAAEKTSNDAIVERSRTFMERMIHHPTRLRAPERNLEVETFLTLQKENTLGCVSLREGLSEPLSHLYFPVELHDVLLPQTDETGQAVAMIQNKGLDQFRKKGAPKLTLDRLQQLEGKQDPEREDREKTFSSGEEEDEEDEDEGDYGIQYHSEGDDGDDMEDDDDEGPTM